MTPACGEEARPPAPSLNLITQSAGAPCEPYSPPTVDRFEKFFSLRQVLSHLAGVGFTKGKIRVVCLKIPTHSAFLLLYSYYWVSHLANDSLSTAKGFLNHLTIVPNTWHTICKNNQQ